MPPTEEDMALKTNFPRNRFSFCCVCTCQRDVTSIRDSFFFTQRWSEEYIIIHASSKYVGKSVSEIDLPEDIRNKYCVNIKRFPMLYSSLSFSLTALTVLSVLCILWMLSSKRRKYAIELVKYQLKKKTICRRKPRMQRAVIECSKSVECERYQFVTYDSYDAWFRRETGEKYIFDINMPINCLDLYVRLTPISRRICFEIKSWVNKKKAEDLLNFFLNYFSWRLPHAKRRKIFEFHLKIVVPFFFFFSFLSYDRWTRTPNAWERNLPTKYIAISNIEKQWNISSSPMQKIGVVYYIIPVLHFVIYFYYSKHMLTLHMLCVWELTYRRMYRSRAYVFHSVCRVSRICVCDVRVLLYMYVDVMYIEDRPCVSAVRT